MAEQAFISHSPSTLCGRRSTGCMPVHAARPHAWCAPSIPLQHLLSSLTTLLPYIAHRGAVAADAKSYSCSASLCHVPSCLAHCPTAHPRGNDNTDLPRLHPLHFSLPPAASSCLLWQALRSPTSSRTVRKDRIRHEDLRSVRLQHILTHRSLAGAVPQYRVFDARGVGLPGPLVVVRHV